MTTYLRFLTIYTTIVLFDCRRDQKQTFTPPLFYKLFHRRCTRIFSFARPPLHITCSAYFVRASRSCSLCRCRCSQVCSSVSTNGFFWCGRLFVRLACVGDWTLSNTDALESRSSSSWVISNMVSAFHLLDVFNFEGVLYLKRH